MSFFAIPLFYFGIITHCSYSIAVFLFQLLSAQSQAADVPVLSATSKPVVIAPTAAGRVIVLQFFFLSYLR